MGNERLLRYIASLSDKEREEYKDLIAETLQRDKILEETFGKTKIYVKDFEENLRRIQEESLHLKTNLSALNEKILEVRDASQTISKIISRGPAWN